VKWGAISTVARFGLQLIAQVVMARILGPETYGLFGMGLVVYTLCMFLANFGLGWSLIQKNDLHDEDIRFAMTWQVIAGLIGTAALYFGAPWIAAYFREPRVESVISWLSLACVISAAASPTNNLLQRDLNFRATGAIQVGSYAVGYLLVGIPVALHYKSVYALVAAWLTQATVTLIASFCVRPHPLKPLFWYAGAKDMLNTGGTVFYTNVCNWLLNNLDRLLIGRLLNAHAVGVYTAGYNLANMPNTLLLGALQPAFLSAGARLQEEPGRLKRAYVEVVSTVFVLITPAFALLAYLAPDLIGVLYGDKWGDAAPVLTILFAAMPAYVLWGLSTPILWNTGRKSYEALLQVPVLIAAAGAFYLWAADGVTAAAAVAAAVLAARAGIISTAACRALGITLPELSQQVMRAAIGCAVVVAGAYLARTLFASLVQAPAFLQHLGALTAATAGALLAATAMVAARPQALGPQAWRMLDRFIPGLSHRRSRLASTAADTAKEEQ